MSSTFHASSSNLLLYGAFWLNAFITWRSEQEYKWSQAIALAFLRHKAYFQLNWHTAHTHSHTHTHTHTYTQTHARACVHVHKCKHAQRNTHTHTQPHAYSVIDPFLPTQPSNHNVSEPHPQFFLLFPFGSLSRTLQAHTKNQTKMWGKTKLWVPGQDIAGPHQEPD